MLQPDKSGETIKVLGQPVRDEWGQNLGREVLRKIEHCVVSPAGDQVVKGEDYTHGDISKLQVIAPAGTVLRDGDVVDIRGEEFYVDPLQSFDYSVERRPALRRHRPKVIVTVSRGEVSDGIA